mgnify:CR=1 FL=1
MEDCILEFKKVSKSFGKNQVLDSIDLSILKGKITGIIGASGEGKSTILKIIVSFYKPEKGKVYYQGKEVLKIQQKVKKEFGFSIEEGSFYEDLTVVENLTHFGKLYGVPINKLNKRVKGMVYFVGLEKAANILAKNLSLGMKKRLDLACSLIHKPSILVLDEPTADLDPLLRKQFLYLIKKINAHGTTVILTTQIMEEAEEICDQVCILYNEKIIVQGNISEIKKKYNSNNLDQVFKKVFSNKRRKTYQESKEKKSKFEEIKKEIKKEIKAENPWDILEKRIEKDNKEEKYKDDL